MHPGLSARAQNVNMVQDYFVTRYIAEFINTLSSLVYGQLKPDAPSCHKKRKKTDKKCVIVAYGIYGLAHGRRNGSRLVSYCGLIGVGVCSAGYHMTLKYHTQMCKLISALSAS